MSCQKSFSKHRLLVSLACHLLVDQHAAPINGGHDVQTYELAILAFCLTTLAPGQPLARDDGRFANSPLKPWFDRLASGKGLCCSFADGVSVEDVDWDTQDGQYRRAHFDGQWVIVPGVACR